MTLITFARLLLIVITLNHGFVIEPHIDIHVLYMYAKFKNVHFYHLVSKICKREF